jgi:DNA topoisomerase VI subunit B
MNSQELMTELEEASHKLDYILSLRDEQDENNHRQAILQKYLLDIKTAISEVSDKINQAYDTIHPVEESDDSDYCDLYDKLLQDVNREKQFFQDFGPSIAWYTFLQSM